MTEQQTPTPIDPADIRPGDVVDVTRRVEVDAIDDRYLLTKSGCLSLDFGGRTFHLVHRPDPDAQAVEALERAGVSLIEDRGRRLEEVRQFLADIRDQGWDVTRRQS